MFRLPGSEMKGKEVIESKVEIDSMEKFLLDNPR